WDDDIDLAMPRPDFDYFIELTEKKILCKNYSIFNELHPYLKLFDNRTIFEEKFIKENLYSYGLFIDIFPIDGVPQEHLIDEHFCKIDKYKRKFDKSLMKIDGQGLLKLTYGLICWAPFRIMGHKRYCRKIELEAKKYSFDSCDNVSVAVWGWGRKDISSKKALLNRIKMRFRDREFWCQSNYVENLTLKYGDYMQLPPIENQQESHGNAYWKE
ncbi:MAG: LicD family protein, partial [Negativicutes bacterium]|nr:LicD family protein [Negativicutes bacterium]